MGGVNKIFPPDLVIGIAGPMGSGKSYAARIMAEHLAKKFGSVRILPLSEALKRCAACILNWQIPKAMLDESKKEDVVVPVPSTSVALVAAAELCHPYTATVAKCIQYFCENHLAGKSMSYGRLLQLLGTECLRTYDEDTFVIAAGATISVERPSVVIIPDVRYDNEARAVENLGGICFRIVPTPRERDDDGRSMSHPSEQGLHYLGNTIRNDYDEKFRADVIAATDAFVAWKQRKHWVSNFRLHDPSKPEE